MLLRISLSIHETKCCTLLGYGCKSPTTTDVLMYTPTHQNATMNTVITAFNFYHPDVGPQVTSHATESWTTDGDHRPVYEVASHTVINAWADCMDEA